MRKLILPAPCVWLAFAVMFLAGNNFARAQNDSCVSPINDINYTRYTVVNAAFYTETNSGPAVIESADAYAFAATVILKTNYSATSAQLIIPNGVPHAMSGTNRNFATDVFTNSFAAVTSNYPGGTYQFIVSNDVTSLDFPSGAELPNAPTLSDYAGAQNIDVTKDYTLKWNPFTNGTAKDLMEVNIDGDISYKSPEYGCPGQLTGKSTSFVIPANTLTSGYSYRVTITFVNILVVNTNSTPFVALLAGTEAETFTKITTITPSGPVISNVAELPDGSVRFDVSVTPGTIYLIESAPNLANPTWTTLLTADPTGTSISFTNKPKGNEIFYRVLPQ